MKRCSTCQRTYSDETLNFCLDDGARLLDAFAAGESPTESFEPSRRLGKSLQAPILRPSESSQPAPVNVMANARPSIAVLPFTPLKVVKRDAYLGLGIADSLITKLSGIDRITVRPTSAIRRYTDPARDSAEVGREQRVDAVLEGSIQRSRQRMRVTARLVDARDGSSLWSYQCDEDSSHILEVEDSIAEKIATSLVNDLSRKEKGLLTKRHTQNVEAFHLYQKGRYHWNMLTKHGLERATEYFQQAVDKDPAYALAYVGLADSYGVLGINYLSPKESLAKAKAAVLKALEIDDTLAEAHRSLGGLKLLYEWDWPGAERELRHAIELKDGYANGYQLYAYYYHAIGQLDVAIALIERALEIDPLSPILNSDLSWEYVLARQYDRAIEQGLKTLEIEPNFAMAQMGIGMAYEHQGLHKKAIKELAKAVKLTDENPRLLGLLGFVYAKAGYTVKARQVLERLINVSKKTHIDPYNIAMVHIGLGENEQAFKSLEQAYEERSCHLISLKVDPMLDDLRPDACFTDLLGRLGL